MNGAREYNRIISEAYRLNIGGLEKTDRTNHFRKGNVIFIIGEHARGKTFKIELDDGSSQLPVYDVINGHPGWTEEYGWIRQGTWCRPILEYLQKLEREIDDHRERQLEKEKEAAADRIREINERVDRLNEMFREVSL